MKTRRYSKAQAFRILEEVDSGIPVVDAARKHGVSPATIHRWESKYGGMTLSELKRLKAFGRRECQAKAHSSTASDGYRLAQGGRFKKW